MVVMTTLYLLLTAASAFGAPTFPSPPLSLRAITPDKTIPDNLRQLSLSIFEYCNTNTLHARAWASVGQASHSLSFVDNQKASVTLPSGKQILFGPYEYEKHALAVEYKGCQWGSDGAAPCGWCEGRVWSSDMLDCVAGGTQRMSWGACYYFDGEEADIEVVARDEMSGLPAVESTFAVSVQKVDMHRSGLHNDAEEIDIAGLNNSPTKTNPIENTDLGFASATTVTAQPAYADSNNDVRITASTVTIQPAIIATALPSSSLTTSIILPFKIQLWEYCTVDKTHLAGGMYHNGNLRSSLDLSPGLLNSVKHFIPDYPNLEVGPFDFEKGILRFGYNGSEWWDFETWKSEGECRAELWSGEALECGGGAMVVRVKEMECSVLLGTKLGVDGE